MSHLNDLWVVIIFCRKREGEKKRDRQRERRKEREREIKIVRKNESLPYQTETC